MRVNHETNYSKFLILIIFIFCSLDSKKLYNSLVIKLKRNKEKPFKKFKSLTNQVTDERSDEKNHGRQNEENAEKGSDRKPNNDQLPVPVAASQEKPVEPLSEPLNLKQANLDTETLKKIEFVVTLEREYQRVNEEQH